MAEIFFSVPILLIIEIAQVTIISKIKLLHGCPDLMLLVLTAWALNENTKYSWLWALIGAFFMTYVSALPAFGYFIAYGIVWIDIRFVRKRIWHMPLILMLFMTIIGTLIENFLTIGLLFIQSSALDIRLCFSQITIPSLALNLIFAIPIYGMINDLALTICGNKGGDA